MKWCEMGWDKVIGGNLRRREKWIFNLFIFPRMDIKAHNKSRLNGENYKL